MNVMTIGIVSHSPIFAAGIRAVLEREADTEVVMLDETTNHSTVHAVLIESDNLLHIQHTLNTWKSINPAVKSAVFLSPMTFHLTGPVMKLGIDMLLDKTQCCDQLVGLIRTVVSSQCVLISQSFWQGIMKGSLSQAETNPPGLTPREREVLWLLDQNYSNAQIADALQISVHTVKRHVEHLLHKLNASNRHDCARLGHQMGLLRMPRTSRLA